MSSRAKKKLDRRALQAGREKYWADPKNRAKQSEVSKAAWRDPAVRGPLTESLRQGALRRWARYHVLHPPPPPKPARTPGAKAAPLKPRPTEAVLRKIQALAALLNLAEIQIVQDSVRPLLPR